ncbi:MAG: methyltransferase domain-containing protein [Opitutaceae bacterium]|nr:methyltransferase domain-containing protein [Opitutaceae bacterium]
MSSAIPDSVPLRRHLASWVNRVRGREDPNQRAARQHRSFDAMSGILAWMLSHAGERLQPAGRPRGRALEIGTGQFMAHAAALYVCGYDRVLTIDRYRQVVPALVRASLETPVLARRLLSPYVDHDDYVARLRRLETTQYDLGRLAETGVEYRAPAEASALLAQDERFDLVFSYTVLEHVPPAEIPGLLDSSSRLLAPGGVALHLIDLEDHRDPRADPFAFLSPTGMWSDEACGERGNRVRRSRWGQYFQETTSLNWTFPYAPVRRDAPLPPRLDAAFQGLDEADLRTSALLAMAVAPGTD